MNIRYFLFFFLAGIFLTATPRAFSQTQNREIYELKIYHLENQEQEKQLDQFLQQAYLPALHRAGVPKVGVFKPVEDDTTFGKLIYVYIPYTSMEQFMEVPQTLEEDQQYNQDGKGYIEAAHNNPPYKRIETVLLQAFEGMPQFQNTNLTNPTAQRIYELRSYEAATEMLFKNKVDMFNQGEIDIFKRLDFNPMFFGEVIAGCKMPNLMYMTAFSDMASRDAHWEAFSADAGWEEMKTMEKYQNNVSHADIMLLNPAPYSEL